MSVCDRREAIERNLENVWFRKRRSTSSFADDTSAAGGWQKQGRWLPAALITARATKVVRAGFNSFFRGTLPRH